ncbi:hypothetical protein DdX_16725 [Ditylenchus destructor]|uniref:Uncharacterized protein n=1 Tax=Ditylenchus destructor TaxID=166010 RepID=A0AAD4QZT7_9BILA|nr:hypothetical protein DdX_16725 [Ditylenchus destructor]
MEGRNTGSVRDTPQPKRRLLYMRVSSVGTHTSSVGNIRMMKASSKLWSLNSSRRHPVIDLMKFLVTTLTFVAVVVHVARSPAVSDDEEDDGPSVHFEHWSAKEGRPIKTTRMEVMVGQKLTLLARVQNKAKDDKLVWNVNGKALPAGFRPTYKRGTATLQVESVDDNWDNAHVVLNVRRYDYSWDTVASAEVTVKVNSIGFQMVYGTGKPTKYNLSMDDLDAVWRGAAAEKYPQWEEKEDGTHVLKRVMYLKRKEKKILMCQGFSLLPGHVCKKDCAHMMENETIFVDEKKNLPNSAIAEHHPIRCCSANECLKIEVSMPQEVCGGTAHCTFTFYMLEKHKPADLWKGIEDTLDVHQMEKDKVKYIMMNEDGEVIGGEYGLSALPTKDSSNHKITVARHENWPKKKSVRFCSEKAKTANAGSGHVLNCMTLKFQDGEHVTDIVVPKENYKIEGLRKDFRATYGIKDEEEFTMEWNHNGSGNKHVILTGSLLTDGEFEKNKWVIRHGSTSSKTKQPYYAACLGKPYQKPKPKKRRGYYDNSSSDDESDKNTKEKMCVTLTLSNGGQLIDLSVESTANVFDLYPIIKDDLKLKRVENMHSFFLLRWNNGELGEYDKLIEVVKDYTKTSEWNVDPETIRYIIP